MPLIPTSVQFELTYACNNFCPFCYNGFGGTVAHEISERDARGILEHLLSAGVFSVNFNGGEPLLHPGFFSLCEYGNALGLALHVNTNATMITNTEARHMAKYFDSVCTTVLSAPGGPHDELSGRAGALEETERGIRALGKAGIYVAANITLCRANATGLLPTLDYLRSLDVDTALITRVITNAVEDREFGLTDFELVRALRAVLEYQNEHRAFARVAFPQPYPPCKFPEDMRTAIRKSNIPCMIGLNTARITPAGHVTPCALVPEPCLGNAVETPFDRIWESFHGEAFFASCMPYASCSHCKDLAACGGGCFGANRMLKARDDDSIKDQQVRPLI
jgi:radical SAM protein with 4Fe4S-binding SPASM domain